MYAWVTNYLPIRQGVIKGGEEIHGNELGTGYISILREREKM